MDSLIALIAARGRVLRLALEDAGFTVRLLFESLARVVPHMRRRWRFILDQMIVCGLSPLPVVSIVGVFTGMILALQLGIELADIGQAERVSNIVGIVLFREMGPFMTGMILTASVGSAMTAELGTMAVSEELDALECMSIDTTSFLVMPRVLALTIMAPILTFIGNILGVVGAALVSKTQLAVSLDLFFRQVLESLEADPGFGGFPEEIYTGLIKATVFGMLIATISCSKGLRASGGALGVGRAVRLAVVRSFLMIIVVGYMLSWMFLLI